MSAYSEDMILDHVIESLALDLALEVHWQLKAGYLFPKNGGGSSTRNSSQSLSGPAPAPAPSSTSTSTSLPDGTCSTTTRNGRVLVNTAKGVFQMRTNGELSKVHRNSKLHPTYALNRQVSSSSSSSSSSDGASVAWGANSTGGDHLGETGAASDGGTLALAPAQAPASPGHPSLLINLVKPPPARGVAPTQPVARALLLQQQQQQQQEQGRILEAAAAAAAAAAVGGGAIFEQPINSFENCTLYSSSYLNPFAVGPGSKHGGGGAGVDHRQIAVCPVCRQPVAGARFAPHLDRCLTGKRSGADVDTGPVGASGLALGGGGGGVGGLSASIFRTARGEPDPHPDSAIVRVRVNTTGITRGVPKLHQERQGVSAEQWEFEMARAGRR